MWVPGFGCEIFRCESGLAEIIAPLELAGGKSAFHPESLRMNGKTKKMEPLPFAPSLSKHSRRISASC
jgi:hypothetical protein